MSRTSTAVLCPFVLLALLSLSAGPVYGQSELDERISIDLEDADVRETLASFADILEREIELDPGVEGTIDIELHGVRIETALTAVCESVGCRWSLARRLTVEADPDAPVRERKSLRVAAPTGGPLDQPIEIDLENATLGDTLNAFGELAGLPVVIAPGVDQEARVTVQIEDAPARQALDAVCEMNGCRWEVVEGGEGAVLHVLEDE